MSLKICILASGSSGNCIYAGTETTSILIDAGLSGRETIHRLELIERRPEDVRAVCVSHEHSDHTAGLGVLHRRHKIPLYANAGTVEALQRNPDFRDIPWSVFTNGSPFRIGDLVIEPFTVPHDAYDPVGFILRAGDVRAGIVTDIGIPTTLVRERLKSCRVLVVESNHDERLLQEAQRPWHLKQRIRGRQGHLSNTAAAQMVAELGAGELEQVFLAHLSEECNRHKLALETFHDIFHRAGLSGVRVDLTYPDRISSVWAG